MSYGEVACRRQGEIMLGLAEPEEAKHTDADEIALEFIKKTL